VLAIIVVAAELVLGRAVGQDVIDDPQERVGESDHGFLRTAMA
jgi:hypothetical protein